MRSFLSYSFFHEFLNMSSHSLTNLVVNHVTTIVSQIRRRDLRIRESSLQRERSGQTVFIVSLKLPSFTQHQW